MTLLQDVITFCGIPTGKVYGYVVYIYKLIILYNVTLRGHCAYTGNGSCSIGSTWYWILCTVRPCSDVEIINTVMRRLMTGIHFEKHVFRRFRRCVNIIESTYTNLDSTV